MEAFSFSSFSMPSLFLPFLFLFILPFHSFAANCSSHLFSNNRTFSLCNSLSSLNATLYWTYNPQNTSVNIAFMAPPAKPTGWIAWAINPNGTGMVGSQALIAFQTNGSMKAQTFNITTYGPVHPSPISFNVSNLTAEFSGGLMTIFATVALPKNETTWNLVWQVGSSVTNGLPDKHAFQPENLNAKGTLNFLNVGNSTAASGGGAANNGTVAAGGGGQQNSTASGGNSNSTTPSPSSLSPRSVAWSSSSLMVLFSLLAVLCIF